MLTRNTIRVSEYERLYYDDAKPFKQKHWEALCRYQEKLGKSQYFRILNKGIQFLNFVGVIQAGSLTIEILPKMDQQASTAANEAINEQSDKATDERASWQKVLLQMLKECRLLQVQQVDHASLRLRSHSILDLYIELFLQQTEALLHQGLLKKYRSHAGNRAALKGQLVFNKQLSQNLIHAERFYVRATEYDRQNVPNQLLRQTLQLIECLSVHPQLQSKASALLIDFPELPAIAVRPETFERIQHNRKTERYQEPLLIAKMLLLNYRPDIVGGSEHVVAILFDMNRLWEEWVYRRLKREEPADAFSVSRQNRKDFWSTDHYTKTIRPDLVLAFHEGPTLVVDTKWKNLDGTLPSDADLKQMFVYNQYWNCEHSILLYPALKDNSSSGEFHPSLATITTSNCSVVGINIFDADTSQKRLDPAFGNRLLGHLVKQMGCKIFSQKNRHLPAAVSIPVHS